MALQIEGRAMPLADSTFRATNLLVPLARFKCRVLLTIAVVTMVGFVYTLTLPPKYVAHVSLLALLRSDYGLRPNAGEAIIGGSSFEVDEIIGTESRLLGRSELHRETIETIGLANIYPGYLEPRTGLRALLHDAKKRLYSLLAQIGIPAVDEPTPAPIDIATIDFDKHLTLSANKASHVIDLSFTHSDPNIAAKALNTLVEVYLHERSHLYGDEQAPIVKAQLRDLQQKVSDADSELAHYKATYDISAFASRREYLMQQQSSLETAVHTNNSTLMEQQARVEDLQSQLRKIPADVVIERSLDVEQRTQPQRQSMDAISARLAQARTTYAADAPIVKQFEAILNDRKREITSATHDGQASITRTAQNPLWLAATGDLLRASDELQASIAKRASAQASLALVEHILHIINQHEERLTQLDRQRAIAEENFRAVSQTYENRRVADIVDRERRESVRVANTAIPPTIDASHNRLILFSFIVIGILLGLFVALVSNYTRRFFLTPQEMEYDLGLPLLVAIPKRSFGRLH
jgi:polysaccharide biosynthesis protein PslE